LNTDRHIRLATGSLAGEPGVGVDLPPPFCARDADTAWLFSLNRQGIRPGLTRIQGLLEDLGNPQARVRTLVVAGTNGKGSTTRILARLLEAAGYRTATYTSPHLLQVTERVQIRERPLDAGDFAARVRRLRPLIEKHGASWFESLTALAVEAAADAEVEFLCCETGLGGRLDASNALPAVATLLTGVGLDHTHILGETLAEIAAEKLGLAKAGTPLFCALPGELKGQAFAAAVQVGAPIHFLDELARWDGDSVGDSWDLALRDRFMPGLPDLGMPFLRSNVSLALLALAELESRLDLSLVPEDPGVALGNLFLPGRYQRILTGPDWVLDTAHNMQALEGALTRFRAEPASGRRIVLLGGMQDKDWKPELGDLLRGVDRLLLTPVSLPRTRNVDGLQAMARAWGREATVASGVSEALGLLASDLGADDRVLVTGSCFLVAEVLHDLGIDDLETTRMVRPAAANPGSKA